MKKIAVLGAGGFVGKTLTEYFGSKPGSSCEVIPVTRKVLDLSDGDGVKAFMKDLKPDAVINCAAVGGSRKNGYNDSGDVAGINFSIYENVEKAISNMPDTVHVIFGSGAQYDKSRPLVKVREKDLGVSVPRDPYGLGKYRIAKALLESGREMTFMPVIFALFGPYEDYTYKFISNACVKTMLGMDITINRNVVFDYLYVDDFCTVLDKILEKALSGQRIPGKIFNVTPTGSVTLETLAGIVRDVSGRSPGIRILNEGLNPEYTGDNSVLLENLGTPYRFLDYRESVERLYRNLEARLPELDTKSVREDAALKYAPIISRN